MKKVSMLPCKLEIFFYSIALVLDCIWIDLIRLYLFSLNLKTLSFLTLWQMGVWLSAMAGWESWQLTWHHSWTRLFHLSLGDQVDLSSLRNTILTLNLVWTPDRHSPWQFRTPELQHSISLSFPVITGLQARTTTPDTAAKETGIIQHLHLPNGPFLPRCP